MQNSHATLKDRQPKDEKATVTRKSLLGLNLEEAEER